MDFGILVHHGTKKSKGCSIIFCHVIYTKDVCNFSQLGLFELVFDVVHQKYILLNPSGPKRMVESRRQCEIQYQRQGHNIINLNFNVEIDQSFRCSWVWWTTRRGRMSGISGKSHWPKSCLSSVTRMLTR